MMEFTARLPAEKIDPAMLLFRLRQASATGTFIAPPKGGGDVQVQGSVPEDKIDALIKTLTATGGALHVADRHIHLGGDEHPTIEEAEAHMDGPYTVLGTSRADWSFGGDEDDHVVQALYFGGRANVKALHEATGRRVETVMRSIQRLASPGTIRRYRTPEGGPEEYDLAGDVRRKLESACG